jgi:selenide,water dikinase
MHKESLLSLSMAGGCAAKIEPAMLQQILTGLKDMHRDEYENINYKEDVGIFSMLAGENLVQSIDMITPVSENPITFGAIAASHALSDIYAKGAYPVSGLLLLGLPPLLVPPTTATAILQGAIDKLHEASARVLGGHTFASQELQLGLAVTGSIINKFVPNIGCQEGDLLILTKPLGIGMIITALKLRTSEIYINGFTDEMAHFSEQSMLILNNTSSDVMAQIGVNACTDITGFGLLGHLYEMLYAEDLSALIYFNKVPLIPGIADIASQDIVTSGGERNAAFYWKNCTFDRDITYAQKMLLFDPQTSGGLLISVPQERGDRLIKELERRGVKAAIIGQITRRQSTAISIVFS